MNGVDIIARGMAGNSSSAAAASASNAEAWAVGKRNGADVPSTDPAYHNNAKYYAEMSNFPKFGVSGVGGSNTTLTRLWDAVGLESVVSTDVTTGSSAFDAYAPFNRKKCVGSWSQESGADKATFTVNAYAGDPDYAEDGSMGDYVAVEVDPFYYFEGGGVLGVSEKPIPGWKIHPVCVDLDGNVREHTYLPCYALAKKDGHAASLPGYHNELGGYKTLWDIAKTYDGAAAASAIIEPSAVDHYEYLLQTIEFATQNMQSVMQGAVSMRYTSDTIHSAPAENKIVVTGTIGGNYVVGQSIVINASYSVSPPSPSVYNCVSAIDKCDEDGTPNPSGAYYLITYDGADRSSDITADVTQLGSRPWITGSTQGYAHGVGAVKGHTGYPVSNGGKYPILYRWRENAYGNQNMTALDLMDVRVDEGDDTYHLDWYYLADPRKYYPASTSKPDTADLDDPAKGWVNLSVQTTASNYKDGYIKERLADPDYPHVPVPTITTGGSATTYYADYAALVSSAVVRAVRRRGSLNYGSSAGPCYVYGNYAPSIAYWDYGGGLFFLQ